MLTNTGLPTYYFGLTEDNVRSASPTAQILPFTRQIHKIPFVDEPHEFADRYLVELNVAGVEPQDIAVITDGRILHIEVEKEFDAFKVTHTNWEKSYGIFYRNLELPRDANFKRIFYSAFNGVLSIEIFKELELTEDAPRLHSVTSTPGSNPQREL